MDITSSAFHPVGLDRPAGGTTTSIAWMDGRVMPASEATVPFNDDGFLRGDAIFEGILVRSGHTHALEEHLCRMRRSAEAMELPLDVAVLRQAVRDLLVAWGARDGAMKLVVTRAGTVRGMIEATRWPDSVALAVLDIPWRTALSGIKTMSYAVNQWAIRQARARGADDALIIDDGVVMELPTGSVCVVRHGVVHVPDPGRLPILSSVTVAQIALLAQVRYAVLTLDDVLGADELFVVSATRPVLPVHAVIATDGTTTDYPCPGPVTTQIGAQLSEHISDTLDA